MAGVSTSPLTKLLPVPLQIDGANSFDATTWAKAMLYIVQRFAALESFEPSWTAAVNELNEVGLSRINDVLLPLFDEIKGISSLGAIFTAYSSAQQTVQTGPATFLIDDPNKWPAFTASQYMAAISADGTAAMAGMVTSYDVQTGLILMEVSYLFGSGTNVKWTLSPSTPPLVGPTIVIDGGEI